MSRHSSEVSLQSWRSAVISLVIVMLTALSAALLIASQGQAISTAMTLERLDEQWTIRSGRIETDRLVLRPTANSISLALHPIDSSNFTWQARVDLGTSPNNGGLIVQADNTDHFTAFLISNDGYFRVSDYRNGAWIDRAAWRAWPHIHRAGAANVLRAECGSNSCTFFVNDEWTWQENEIPATRWIGVVANGTAESRFDQLGWQP